MPKFIRITTNSFPKTWHEDLVAQLRSFEKYLDRTHRTYTCDDFEKIFTVKVTDKLDAIKILRECGLTHVLYHEDGVDTELNTSSFCMKERPSATVTLEGGAKKMSLNQYKKLTLGELKKTHITKGRIIKVGLISKTKLQHYIDDGTLTAVRYGRMTFIDKNELFKLI